MRGASFPDLHPSISKLRSRLWRYCLELRGTVTLFWPKEFCPSFLCSSPFSFPFSQSISPSPSPSPSPFDDCYAGYPNKGRKVSKSVPKEVPCCNSAQHRLSLTRNLKMANDAPLLHTFCCSRAVNAEYG